MSDDSHEPAAAPANATVRPAGIDDEGTVAAWGEVPARDVPDRYPVEARPDHAIHPDRALGLDVETDDGVVVRTFLPWPEGGTGEGGGEVDRLLDALGLRAGDFDGLVGERVPLAAEGEWHRVNVDEAERRVAAARADPGWTASELAVAAAVAVAAVAYVGAAELPVGAGAVAAAVGWVVVPAAVFFDLRGLDDAVDLKVDPERWQEATLLPLVNVPGGLAYLVERHVRAAGATPRAASDAWLKVLVAGVLVPVVAVALVFLQPAAAPAGFFLYLYGLVLVPCALYFDARHVAAATDWEPDGVGYALGAFVAGVVLASPLLVAWYLVRRHLAFRRA